MEFSNRPRRRREAATYLFERHGIQRTPGTLAKLASVGGGPEFRRVGRVPLYSLEALDRWAESMTSPPVHNTSELRRGAVLHSAKRTKASS